MGHTSPPSSPSRPSRTIAKSSSSSSSDAHLLARRIVCVPRHEISTHIAGVVRDFVDAERLEVHNFVDSELVDRLGSSMTLVAELVVQLMERQRTVVRLRRELTAVQHRRDEADEPRPSTPVNG
jgi:hypothetical protein